MFEFDVRMILGMGSHDECDDLRTQKMCLKLLKLVLQRRKESNENYRF